MKHQADTRHGAQERRPEPVDPLIPPRPFTGRFSLVEEPIVECLYSGFSRCGEAEERLSGCVSDDERLVLEEHLKRVKRELQEDLDRYVDSRVARWFDGRHEPRHSGRPVIA